MIEAPSFPYHVKTHHSIPHTQSVHVATPGVTLKVFYGVSCPLHRTEVLYEAISVPLHKIVHHFILQLCSEGGERRTLRLFKDVGHGLVGVYIII